MQLKFQATGKIANKCDAGELVVYDSDGDTRVALVLDPKKNFHLVLGRLTSGGFVERYNDSFELKKPLGENDYFVLSLGVDWIIDPVFADVYVRKIDAMPGLVAIMKDEVCLCYGSGAKTEWLNLEYCNNTTIDKSMTAFFTQWNLLLQNIDGSERILMKVSPPVGP